MQPGVRSQALRPTPRLREAPRGLKFAWQTDGDYITLLSLGVYRVSGLGFRVRVQGFGCIQV